MERGPTAVVAGLEEEVDRQRSESSARGREGEREEEERDWRGQQLGAWEVGIEKKRKRNCKFATAWEAAT